MGRSRQEAIKCIEREASMSVHSYLHLHTYKFTSGGLVKGCEALEDSSYKDIKVATLRSISVPVLSGSKAVCLIVGGPVITTLRIRVIERKKY